MGEQIRCARRWATAGWLGWTLLLAIAIPARAERPEVPRWIAADAAIYVAIPQPGLLLDRALGDAFQKALGAVPRYARYLESDSYKTTRAIVDQIAGKLDTTWDKGVRKLTGGGIVLAVEASPGKPPRVVLVVTPSDPVFLDRTNKTLLELARQDAANKGNPDPVKPIEHRGTTGYGLDKGAYAIIQGALTITDSPETLKIIIDRSLDGVKAGASLADDNRWKTARGRAGSDAMAWGLVRLDRVRAFDPKLFKLDENSKIPLTLLFGSWVEAIQHAEWASATISWSEDRLGAELTVPTPSGGYRAALKGFVPPKGQGAAALANPPGTIASLSLWRDLSSLWEARTELLPPEAVQGLAKLDGFAGQFFGGRDFGTGVLGAFANDWRLVVAHQDFQAMNPVPDQKLPAFALVVDLKPDDDEFAQRLKVAFQSFVGLANLGAAEQKSKAPPLELGSETVDGVTIATARFMRLKTPTSDAKEPVDKRHNFSPSIAQVDNHFVLSSSAGLARDLIKALRNTSRAGDSTLTAEADGPELARLLELNRERMVMQNMLEKGHDKAKAQDEVGLLFHLLRYLGHARLAVQDGADATRLNLNFALSQ